MTETTVVLVTLIVYKIVLVGIGLFTSRRNKDEADFFLAGRGLGPWVAAISASASSSSAWTLLGVSGFAYTRGLSALWLFPACVGGFLINWYFIAPGLYKHSHQHGSLTLTDVLAMGPYRGNKQLLLARIASLIVLFSFVFYVASQFQGSGKTFQATFDMNATQSIVIGALIIMIYTMLGGFWAVSITDTLQGFVMAFTAILLPVAAWFAVGDQGGFLSGLRTIDQTGYLSLTQDMPMAAGIGFVLGLLGIGLGYPGQPHVVNRFMALRDPKSLVAARRIALGWAILVYSGMILLGLCGRILWQSLGDAETILVVAANQLFPPALAGMMIAAVLSATMSTADSQLLVAASSVSHDSKLFHQKNMVRVSRLVVFGISISAVALALFGRQDIFDKVLFAWTAMGAAFGPLLIVILFRGYPRFFFALAAMSVGFLTAVTAYWVPWARGGWLERILPFLLSFTIAWIGSKPRAEANHSMETKP